MNKVKILKGRKKIAMTYVTYTILLSMIVITVSGCAINSGNNLLFCDGYTPVPTLDIGSIEQILNTDKNNAVYLDKCLS